MFILEEDTVLSILADDQRDDGDVDVDVAHVCVCVCSCVVCIFQYMVPLWYGMRVMRMAYIMLNRNSDFTTERFRCGSHSPAFVPSAFTSRFYR